MAYTPPQPTPTASIAVESAKRAARSGLKGVTASLDQRHNLSALHSTISHEAGLAGVELYERLDALARTMAVEINASLTDAAIADVGRTLMHAITLSAKTHLEVLLAMPRSAFKTEDRTP